MTTTRVRQIGVAAAALLVLWLVGVAAARLASPPAALEEDLEEHRARVGAAERALEDEARVAGELSAFVDRTLGADWEMVDHRLRTRLNRLAEAVGLEGATVGTGKPSVLRSPARMAFPRSDRWRVLRDEPDFVEIEAWIGGRATFAQVIELVDRVQSEPWIKSVHGLNLTPKDNAEQFAVSLRLTSLFVPDRAPRERSPQAYDYDRSRLTLLEPLLAANPFRVPVAVAQTPEPEPEPEPVIEEPPPAPAFPWSSWTLTGVAAGPSGAEAWVRNGASGETQRLSIGEKLGKAMLTRAGGEWAVFELGGERFRVQVGDNMSHRGPVSE